MTDAVRESSLMLPDGRRMGYAEYGDPSGLGVFYFHGLPGSRHEPAVFGADAARRLGVRLVALERPGYGLSSPQPDRCLRDFPADVAAVADALGLEHFFVLGYSGGGVSALACAWALPERVRAAAFVNGLGPLDGSAETGLEVLPVWHPQRLLLGTAARSFWLLRLCASWIISSGRRDLEFFFSRMTPADQRVAQRAEVREWLRGGMLGESQRQGIDATVQDLQLALLPWGFPVEDIRVPVCLFAGTEDPHCPPAMARALSRHIAGASLTVLEGAGHFAVFDHFEEMLRALLGAART